jgi:hypothetical protein
LKSIVIGTLSPVWLQPSHLFNYSTATVASLDEIIGSLEELVSPLPLHGLEDHVHKVWKAALDMDPTSRHAYISTIDRTTLPNKFQFTLPGLRTPWQFQKSMVDQQCPCMSREVAQNSLSTWHVIGCKDRKAGSNGIAMYNKLPPLLTSMSLPEVVQLQN